MASLISNEYQGEDIRQEEAPPKSPPEAKYPAESDYLDGNIAPLQGINPSQDQDRQRVDNCTPASYSYNSRVYAADNETGIMEGY